MQACCEASCRRLGSSSGFGRSSSHLRDVPGTKRSNRNNTTKKHTQLKSETVCPLCPESCSPSVAQTKREHPLSMEVSDRYIGEQQWRGQSSTEARNANLPGNKAQANACGQVLCFILIFCRCCRNVEDESRTYVLYKKTRMWIKAHSAICVTCRCCWSFLKARILHSSRVEILNFDSPRAQTIQ